MAIYALAIKHKAKGKGASAHAHALYIAREGKYAERAAGSHSEYLSREGKHQGRARELEATWSGNMPTWATNPKEFWDTADTYERANGVVYTEIVVAIPRELSKAGRVELIEDFVGAEIGARFPYTVAIHNPKAMDGGEQPHAHIMFSIRERDGIERSREQFFRRANPTNPELGGTRKSREWSKDDRDNDRVNEIRLTWEKLANKALERAGYDVRIDRRTLKAQGIDRVPEPKMGPVVTQRLKRGLETELGDKVIELRNYRKQEREISDLEEEIKREKAKIFDFEKEKERRQERGGDEFRFSGRKRTVPEDERERYRRTVDLVLTRYEREDGNTEYRWKKSGQVAFVDMGERITFNSITPTAVKAGLQVAREKGWEGVLVSGCEEFRRESWIQGQMMAIPIQGYEPRAEDFALLEERKREEELKKAQYRQKEPDRNRGHEVAPERDQKKAAHKDLKVIEVNASELSLQFKREIIPELEATLTKTMNELETLGYQGRPDDLMYYYGALKRWKELPSDAELRERTFEILGGASYKQQKDLFWQAITQVSENERKLEGLAKDSEKSFLKKISLKQRFEKKKLREELERVRKWRDSAKEGIEKEQQRLSTGKNKDRFDQTHERLTSERASTEQKRKTVEQQRVQLDRELTEAYELKRKLETLGQTRVRFVYDKGVAPRPEDPIEFKRQLDRAKDLERKLGKNRGRSR